MGKYYFNWNVLFHFAVLEGDQLYNATPYLLVSSQFI